MWGRGVLPAALPAPFSATLSLALSVYLRERGAAGSASGQTACPIRPTLRQSQSHHGNASPLCPGCPSLPLLPVWMNVYFLFPWCWTSLPLDFLSVLAVQGGAVCLPMPPSWFSATDIFLEKSKPLPRERQLPDFVQIPASGIFQAPRPLEFHLPHPLESCLPTLQLFKRNLRNSFSYYPPTCILSPTEAIVT